MSSPTHMSRSRILVGLVVVAVAGCGVNEQGLLPQPLVAKLVANVTRPAGDVFITCCSCRSSVTDR